MKARKKLFPKRWSAGFCLILSLISLLATACSAPTGKDSPSYIYLIRHGRTYSNEQGLLVGRGGNYDLTKEAAASAKEVGETLHEEGVEFDQAYSSTLGRAYDTAEYILEGAKEQDLKVDQMAELDDISWGDAEGYTQEEFMEKYDLDTFPDAFGSADDPNLFRRFTRSQNMISASAFQRGWMRSLPMPKRGRTCWLWHTPPCSIGWSRSSRNFRVRVSIIWELPFFGLRMTT